MKKLSTHSKSSIKELSSQQRLWLGLHKLTPPATGQEDRAPFTTTSTQVAAPTLEKSSKCRKLLFPPTDHILLVTANIYISPHFTSQLSGL